MTADIMLRLCELTQECPQRVGVVKPSQHPQNCRGGCRGTGLMPLLDSALVRQVEPVWGNSHTECVEVGGRHCLFRLPYNKVEVLGTFYTNDCQGHGYIPSPDPWAYVRAALMVKPDLSLRGKLEVAMLCWLWGQDNGEQDPGPVCLVVVAEALLGEDGIIRD